MIGYGWLLLPMFLVGVDQITKALAPPAKVTLDPGAGTWLPSFVGQLYKGSATGGLMDLIGGLVLLGAAGFVILRVKRPVTLAGSVVLLSGLTSNLLDRLGMDRVTQGVPGRYVVNWFCIKVDRVQLGNVADISYAVGIGLLLFVFVFVFVNRAVRYLAQVWRRRSIGSVGNVVAPVPAAATTARCARNSRTPQLASSTTDSWRRARSAGGSSQAYGGTNRGWCKRPCAAPDPGCRTHASVPGKCRQVNQAIEYAKRLGA